MTVTINTAKFVGILSDALAVGSAHGGGIHFASTRGPWRDEPGAVDLLAVTGITAGETMGHTWIPVDGHIQPSVWPISSTASVLALCRTLAKKGDAHSVDIDVEVAPPNPDRKRRDEEPGWIVSVKETPSLFDSETALEFHAHPESKFPLKAFARIFGHDPQVQQGDYEPSPCTLWAPHTLVPLAQVAKRRKMQIRFFRSLFRRTQIVQIGDTWIGAAWPKPPIPGEPVDCPSNEPVSDFGGYEPEPEDPPPPPDPSLYDSEGGDEQ